MSKVTLLYPHTYYTPIKVKSKQREENRWLANRPADLLKSTNDTTCFFFWLQNLRECILFLVDISW